LFKNKIIKNSRALSYSMPFLEHLSLCDREVAQPSKSDPETIEREAFERGFESGEKAGYEMGEQKAVLLLEPLKKLLKEIYSLKEKMLGELEPQMVLLSINVARKILKEELQSRPEIAEVMIKEAVKKISPIGPITIKLNRPLYDLITKKKKEFQEIFPDLILELDTRIPGSGAVVGNFSQEIQTDLDFQLSNVIEDLRGYMENA